MNWLSKYVAPGRDLKKVPKCLQRDMVRLHFRVNELPRPDGDIRSAVERLSHQVLRDLKNVLITQEGSLLVF